ncbi:MAG: AAA family ATPase [Candidatus Omnitrophota bacterium]
MTKKIFLAATSQNEGKTTVSLGLIANLKSSFKNIGFIKPIGQRYLEEEGQKIDEDSILIEEVFGFKEAIKDMSPIAVERGFTEKYINDPDKEELTCRIKDSFLRISKDKDFVVVEGTGHAGVGSVFDHSNAVVARLLDAGVILVSSGGIGKPIDEILLNKALFDKEGVKLIGVVINKVIPEKFNKIDKLIRRGLERFGINVLGAIPYNPVLSAPSIYQILDETRYKLIWGEKLDNLIEEIVVGAMAPRDALKFFKDKNSLLITPGDRRDLILTALKLAKSKKTKFSLSGIILTGGILPDKNTIKKIKRLNIPVILTDSDTYKTSSTIHDLTVKVRPKDKEKIDLIIKMVGANLNLKEIIDGCS